MESERITNGMDADYRRREPAYRREQRLFSIPNIIGIILCVLMLPGFVVSMTLFVSSLIHPGIPPSCFGITPLMVESGSMSPLFDEGDLVLIQSGADDTTYTVGDIVCFQSGNAYVTHRIKEVAVDEIGKTMYTTQGDANNTPDKDPVRPDQILGVYKTHWKGVGKALLFIQTPIGMIVCVMLPIFIVFLLFTVPPRIAARKKRKAHLVARRIPPDFGDGQSQNEHSSNGRHFIR